MCQHKILRANQSYLICRNYDSINECEILLVVGDIVSTPHAIPHYILKIILHVRLSHIQRPFNVFTGTTDNGKSSYYLLHPLCQL